MKKSIAAATLGALAVCAASFAGESLTKGSEPSPPAVVLKAARILDVRAGRLFPPGSVVVVRGERIESVGPSPSFESTARIVDLGDATLLPGLIDAHSHVLANIDSADPNGYLVQLATKSSAYRALEGAANARKILASGFTMVRDVENEGSGWADVALRDAIEAGLVPGPRMRVATRGIAAHGQYNPFGVSPELPDFPRGAQMVSGVEECRRAVREQIGNGADHIKIYADWQDPTLTLDELRVIVSEAHRANRRVTAHATTIPGIRAAIEAGVDSIEHGTGADRATLEEMKKRGVTLVPTLAAIANGATSAPSERVRAWMAKEAEKARDMVRTAKAVGVRIVAGNDAAEARRQGTAARELAELVRAGLTPLEAIRAATTSAAELIGWDDRVGSLEKGRFADVIAVKGDPLTDIGATERVSFVMKGGEIVIGGPAR